MNEIVSFILGGIVSVLVVGGYVYWKNKQKADELLRARVKEELEKVQNKI